MKLPWSAREYEPLRPSDLSDEPPTADTRVRVAAAMATASRDANIQGESPPFNMETIRLVLTMSDDQWRLFLPELRIAAKHLRYDLEDGEKRFKQFKTLHGV